MLFYITKSILLTTILSHHLRIISIRESTILCNYHHVITQMKFSVYFFDKKVKIGYISPLPYGGSGLVSRK